MDEETDPIDTSDSPLCPDCEYIVFSAREYDDGEYYCMECSTAFDENEVIYND